jgi:hypothetical protein
VWRGELLASSRKFDTNIKNEAVKRTWELATKENGPVATHDPRALNADSKPSIPFSSLGPTLFKIGRHLWHKNADTDIYYFRNIPDTLPEGWDELRVRQQRGLHNKSLSRYLLKPV